LVTDRPDSESCPAFFEGNIPEIIFSFSQIKQDRTAFLCYNGPDESGAVCAGSVFPDPTPLQD